MLKPIFDGSRALFEDFQRKALLQLHSSGPQDRAHGARRATLFSDHFPQVRRMNTKLEHRDLLSFYGPDGNLLGIVHESFSDGFDELFYFASRPPPLRAAPGE